MESRDGIRTWNLSLFLLPYEGNNNLRTKMNNKKTAKKIMKKPSTRTTIASATIIAIVASARYDPWGTTEPNFTERTSTKLWQ